MHYLFLLIGINGMQVLVDELLPEANLDLGEVLALALAKVSLLHPEGVDEVVPLLFWPAIAAFRLVSNRIQIHAIARFGHSSWPEITAG